MTTGLIFVNLVLLCVHGRLLGKNLGLVNNAAGSGLKAAEHALLAGM